MDAGITADIDPLLLAKEGRHISGELPLSDLPRLADLSSEPSTGRINVDLQFSCDENQKYWLQGNVHGQLEVICQRCLEQMPLILKCQVNTLLVSYANSSEIESHNSVITDIEETLVVCEGKTTVADLIEDDLLLAMPMFTKHEAGSCTNKSSSKRTGQEESGKENPFAVLATLKRGNKTGKK